jgi:hypothetical protein
LCGQVLYERLPAFRARERGLPAALDGWFRQALERDPARRFQSAEQLVEALGQALGVAPDEELASTRRSLVPFSAFPSSGLSRVSARARRFALLASVFVVLGLAAGLHLTVGPETGSTAAQTVGVTK